MAVESSSMKAWAVELMGGRGEPVGVGNPAGTEPEVALVAVEDEEQA